MLIKDSFTGTYQIVIAFFVIGIILLAFLIIYALLVKRKHRHIKIKPAKLEKSSEGIKMGKLVLNMNKKLFGALMVALIIICIILFWSIFFFLYY
jgi:hypothetical protein